MFLFIVFYKNEEGIIDYITFDSSWQCEEFLKNNSYYSDNIVGSPMTIEFSYRAFQKANTFKIGK